MVVCNQFNVVFKDFRAGLNVGNLLFEVLVIVEVSVIFQYLFLQIGVVLVEVRVIGGEYDLFLVVKYGEFYVVNEVVGVRVEDVILAVFVGCKGVW